MKELSIEEKAKRYDNILEKAQKLYNTNEGYRGIFEDVFPELKESEDDKIMKALIDTIKFYGASMESPYMLGISKEDVLTWLEAQGEHANFLNKIQVGDKVTRNKDGVLVNLSQLDRVAKPSEKQGELRSVDFALYNDLKPWEKSKYIINAINEKRAEPVLKGEALHKFKNEFNSLKQILHLLYDYGNPIHYRLALHWAFWGAHNLKDCFGMSENEINKMGDVIGEQKAADTEVNLVDILKHYPKETELYSPLYGKLWLAEVDCKNGIITCYKQQLDNDCTRATLEQEDTVSFYSNGTTGLPDFTITKECMLFLYEQKPVEWSEDDKENFEKVINSLSAYGDKLQYEGFGHNKEVIQEYIYWLKSLRPQTTWKPSDEQMKALAEALSLAKNCGEENAFDLRTLYEQLKKLMEE